MIAAFRRLPKMVAVFGVLGAMTLLTQPARATVYYWDITSTSTWTTGANWSNNATTAGTTGTVPLSTDTAIFNQSSVNGSETVQFSADATIAGLTFANTGSTLLESSSSTAQNLTIGSSGITVSAGAGAVTLGDPTNVLATKISASQTWANNATNSSSALTLLGPVTSTASTGTTTLTLGGTNTGANTVAGAITSNTGNVVAVAKTGVGTWILSGANTYTGGTTINDGTLKMGADNVLLSTGALAISETTGGHTAVLDLNGHNESVGAITFNGNVAGGGTSNIIGTGTLTMTNGLTYSGGSNEQPSTISVGTLDLGGTAVTTFQINKGSASLANPTSADVTISSIIQDGKVNKNGAGTLLLTGTNTYAGGTQVQGGGTLLVGNNSALGSGNLAMALGSAISAGSATSYVLGNTVSVGNGGGGTFGLAGTGDLTFGALTVGTSTTSAPIIITVNNGNTTFASIASAGGTNVITKAGTGALIVAGNTTVASTTYDIQGGMLAVAGTMTVNNLKLDGGVAGLNGTYIKTLGTSTAGTVQWASAASGGFAAYGSSSTWGNSANNLTVDINNSTSKLTYGGTNFLASGQTLILGNASSNGTVDFQNGLDFAGATQTVQVDHGVTNTAGGYDAKLSGVLTDGGLAKTGLGSLALTNANTYTGPTTVTAGTLVAANTTGSATGSGAVTVGTGTANSGTLAGKGFVAGAGVAIQGGGTLASGDRSQVSGRGLSSVGGMTISSTPLTIGSSTGTANLTFLLGSGSTGINGGIASGRLDFSNPNNNTTYLKLTGSTVMNFAGTTSITLVDLTNTTGTNGSLTLAESSPYLLVNAASNADYENLVIVTGTPGNLTYSLSQNDVGVNGYVAGIYTGGLADPTSGQIVGNIGTIDISEFGADGVTPLANVPGGDYTSPELFLDGGDLEVVPEPGTWAMMLSGLALLVLVQKVRRKNG